MLKTAEAGGANAEIVWAASPTPNDSGTGPTASQLAFPACEPLNVHCPTARNDTVDPAIVHTIGVVDVIATAPSDVAIAVTDADPLTAAPEGGGEKVIVCDPCETVIV
jgi:hypothetical protein